MEIHEAIYWFCADFHGGQNCPLYSILSTSAYKPGIMEYRPSCDAAQLLYEDLVAVYEHDGIFAAVEAVEGLLMLAEY